MGSIWMDIASKSSDIGLRPCAYTVARLEGVGIVAWVLAHGRRKAKADA